MSKYGFDFNMMRSRIDYLENYLCNNEHLLGNDKINEINLSIELIEKILYTFDENIIIDSYNEYTTSSSNMDLIKKLKDYIESDLNNNPDYIINRNLICKKLYDSAFRKKEFDDYEFNTAISNEDAVELVGKMIIKKFGINHYNVYKSFFINQCNHIEFSNKYTSFLHCAKMPEDVFVVIRDEDDITKTVDIAHEAGHYFSRTIRPYEYFSKDSILCEVESTFYEIMMLNYLIEENIDKKAAYRLLYSLINETVFDKAAIVFAEYDYPMYKLNSVKDFKIMANKYDLYERTGFLSSRDLLNEIIACNSDNIFNYVYSTIIAFNLFDEYITSRNKKNIVLKYEKFLKEIGKIDDFKLASYIDRDFISFDNYKVLKKYNQKCVENK